MMSKEERNTLINLLVREANPKMGPKWDTKMYRQKEEIIKILEYGHH